MGDIEESSFAEGTEQSFMSVSSMETQEAPQKQDKDNRRLLFFCLPLLLLLLLLGLYWAFMPASGDSHEDDAAVTEQAFYKKWGGSPPRPPATTTPKELTKPTTHPKPKTSRRRPTTTPSTTTTTTTTTTTRTPSTGYGYMVCTMGRNGFDIAMFPIKRELCDIVVFTHVYAGADATIRPVTGFLSFGKFMEAATLYNGDRHTRFGLSHSPKMLDFLLSGNADAKNRSSAFKQATEKLFANASFPSIGVMGLVKKANEFTHDPKLANWYKALAASVKNLPNVTIFLGIKLKDKGHDLATKKILAEQVFRTAKDMKVTLLVLVTHNVEHMGNTTCAAVPISSWKARAYNGPTKPALEHMFKFLEFVLRGEKELEVALSSTLVFMGYAMRNAVAEPVKFGEACQGNRAQPFYAYCVAKLPNEREHQDSLTAVGFNGTSLYTFETKASVEKKMRRFVLSLDDKVFRRVGWAFFDLSYEVYNKNYCTVSGVVTEDFPRLTAAKTILEENRNRKFN
ncbi:uncharacterized protein [Dermacentor albipictus]|uniref:uncharacterized protein isoform X2 n=1 Tax=Dermacentor albipictus TaxID=60249 RepID=UPI0031FC5E48